MNERINEQPVNHEEITGKGKMSEKSNWWSLEDLKWGVLNQKQKWKTGKTPERHEQKVIHME